MGERVSGASRVRVQDEARTPKPTDCALSTPRAVDGGVGRAARGPRRAELPVTRVQRTHTGGCLGSEPAFQWLLPCRGSVCILGISGKLEWNVPSPGPFVFIPQVMPKVNKD